MLSKITGKRREEIAEEIKKCVESIGAFAARAMLSTDEQRKAFDATLEALVAGTKTMSPAFAKGIEDMFTFATGFGQTATNELVNLITGTGGPAAAAMERVRQLSIVGQQDGKEMSLALHNLQLEMGKSSNKTIARMALFDDSAAKAILLNNQVAKVQLENQIKYGKVLGDANAAELDRKKKAAEEGLTEEAKMTANLGKAASELAFIAGKIRTGVVDAFGPLMTNSINKISKFIEERTTGIEKLTQAAIETIKLASKGAEA